MNYQTFNEKVSKKDFLYIGQDRLDESVIKETVQLVQSVNAGDDLTIGSCGSASVSCELRRIDALPDLAGQEITWMQGANTRTNHYEAFARAARPTLAVVSGDLVYVASNRAPYLSVWNLSEKRRLDVDFTPPNEPVSALLLYGETLLCVLGSGVTAYGLSGETLSEIPVPDMTTFQQYQIQYAREHNRAIAERDGVLSEHHVSFYDGKPVDLIEELYEFSKMGVFRAEKPVKSGRSTLSLTAYDRMSLFDRDVSGWFDSVELPVSLGGLFISLCDHMGVPGDATFLNSDYTVQNSFQIESISGRDFLSCIAEVAGSFAWFDRDGILRLDWYRDVDFTVRDAQDCYSESTVAEYTVETIDRIQVKATESDIGVIWPETGSNTYIILDNPLLYTQSEDEILPAMQNILTRLAAFPAYVPIEAEINGNPLLNAGDIIRFEAQDGTIYSLPVMTRSMGRNDVIASTGNAEREENTDVNRSLIALRGKTNELTRTIEEIRLAMGDLEAGLLNEITVTAEALKNRISSTDGAVSTLRNDLTGLSQEVSTVDGTVQTLQSTVNGFSTIYATKDGVTNEIKSSIEGISLSVDNRSTYSRISLEYGGVTIATSGRIEFTGEVVFVDDLSDGQTVISADNIQTGNIDLTSVTLSNRYGSFSAASGSTGVSGTRGARVTGTDEDIYLIVTNAACRMTAYDNSFYVSETRIHADIDIDVGSDARLKSDIAYDVAERYREAYMAFKPARFRLRSGTSGRFHTGFIAQDVKDAIESGGMTTQDLAALVQENYDPESVQNDGLYAMRYPELIALNTAFVQELMARVEELEARLAALEGEHKT